MADEEPITARQVATLLGDEYRDSLTDEQLVNEVTHFEPSLSDADMEQLEQHASGNSVGLGRRLCLVARAWSAEDLGKMAMENPEAFEAMTLGIIDFQEHAKGLLEIAKTAETRMLIASCYSDELFRRLKAVLSTESSNPLS